MHLTFVQEKSKLKLYHTLEPLLGEKVLAHSNHENPAGSWSRICVKVLTGWIKRQRQGGLQIPPPLNPAASLAALNLPTLTLLLYCALMAF